MRTLEKLHPLPCFLYFFAVIGMTIFSRDPVILAESLLGAVLTAALAGRLRGAAWLLLTSVLAAITNPLFSHRGATPLFFVGDTAFTLEAILYGAAFGVMLAAAVLWGASAVRFMTSDKYIWLFGSVFPGTGPKLRDTLCAAFYKPHRGVRRSPPRKLRQRLSRSFLRRAQLFLRGSHVRRGFDGVPRLRNRQARVLFKLSLCEPRYFPAYHCCCLWNNMCCSDSGRRGRILFLSRSVRAEIPL